MFLKILQYSLENTCFEIFFNKVAGLQDCSFIKKRLQHRHFLANIAKFLRTIFNMENLPWLLLQVLYKKAVSKHFPNFTRMYRYRSPPLSSCRLLTWNFVRCFAVNLVKFLRTILCRTNLNSYFWTLRNAAGNKCSRN